jgi:hypothetical protein
MSESLKEISKVCDRYLGEFSILKMVLASF